MTEGGVQLSDELWPRLDHASLRETVEHLHRLVQVAGKYTLTDLFEPGWGNIVLDVTSRGLRTPTFRQESRTFEVAYRLLDNEVTIEADTGARSVPLRRQSVADFYRDFLAAAGELGVPAPRSPLACEIPGATRLDQDTERRPWDSTAARDIWAALSSASAGLRRWQAPFRGYRPRVGVMWGAFDLSSTRYLGRYTEPPHDRPAFLQHGMTEQYVSVGFAFGTDDAPQAGMYAYIAPRPAEMETRDAWGAPDARWDPAEGLVLLPWNRLIEHPDPASSIVAFGDAVYDAAVTMAQWPADMVMARFDGWHASSTPPRQTHQVPDQATTENSETR